MEAGRITGAVDAGGGDGRFPGPQPAPQPAPATRRRATNAAPHGGEPPSGGDEHTSDPERQLWCAVIIHTLYEASGRISYAERGEHDAVRREAVAWFQDAGDDFRAVCDLAGFLPGAVRDGALHAIQRGRLPRIRIPKAG